MDLVVLDLRKAAGFTDYFVICSGTNPRQIRAIADAVMEALAAEGVKPAHVEGYDRSEWILLDYFDFIVHIFAPETRALLRPRAAVGQRRAHRVRQRSPIAAALRVQRLMLDSCRSALPSPTRVALPSSSRRRAAPPAARLLEHPTRGPVCDGCWRRSCRSRRRSATAAAIRCRRGARSACRSRCCPRCRRARPRRSIARARSAPTTARCARSSTR